MNDALRMLDALAQAREVARRIGAEEYLKAQARAVASELKARPGLPEHITVSPGGMGRPQKLRVKRVTISAGVRRSIKLADLKRRFPAAYQAAVTTSAPDEVYQVRFDPIKAGKPSTEWKAIKAEGATGAAQALSARFGTWDWSQVSRQAAALYGIREMAAGTTKQIKVAKHELVLFITDNELPLIIPSYLDAKLVLRENAIRTKVDYEELEQRFPGAAELITRTPTAAQERLIFVSPALDPDEVDDSDDSAMGIWKD